VALFTLTLFRRGRSVHRATHSEDAGQRSPVRDVVQYNAIAECGINGTQPATPVGVVNKGNTQIIYKLAEYPPDLRATEHSARLLCNSV